MVLRVVAALPPQIGQNKNILFVNVPSDAGKMNADITMVRRTLPKFVADAAEFTEQGSWTTITCGTSPLPAFPSYDGW